jgi:hypothetical protein
MVPMPADPHPAQVVLAGKRIGRTWRIEIERVDDRESEPDIAHGQLVDDTTLLAPIPFTITAHRSKYEDANVIGDILTAFQQVTCGGDPLGFGSQTETLDLTFD